MTPLVADDVAVLSSSSVAQLWVEEQVLLAEHAATVPSGGTIVEIGTAQGGSALILHQAAAGRGVRIVSCDRVLSSEARLRLRETAVQLLDLPSTQGAVYWRSHGGQPIDLLFIDGSHSLQEVVDDINAWVPLLRPGGTVLFHDYDVPDRGGLVHLGVQIAIDTLCRSGWLQDKAHHYRFFSGRVAQPHRVLVTPRDCHQNLRVLATALIQLEETEYSGWMIVGEPQTAAILRVVLRGLDDSAVVSPDQVHDPHGRYLVCARPLVPAIEALRASGIPSDSVRPISNLQLCYLLASGLRTQRDRLMGLSQSRGAFLRWEETHDMLEEATGGGLRFPHRLDDQILSSDLRALSRLVATEHVRLACLAQILEKIVGWRP